MWWVGQVCQKKSDLSKGERNEPVAGARAVAVPRAVTRALVVVGSEVVFGGLEIFSLARRAPAT